MHVPKLWKRYGMRFRMIYITGLVLSVLALDCLGLQRPLAQQPATVPCQRVGEVAQRAPT